MNACRVKLMEPFSADRSTEMVLAEESLNLQEFRQNIRVTTPLALVCENSFAQYWPAFKHWVIGPFHPEIPHENHLKLSAIATEYNYFLCFFPVPIQNEMFQNFQELPSCVLMETHLTLFKGSFCANALHIVYSES